MSSSRDVPVPGWIFRRIERYGFLVCLFVCLLAGGCAEKRANAYIDQLDNPDRQVREKAGQQLVAIGKGAVPLLLVRAAAGSDTLQYISAQIMGQIGDPRAIPFLQRLSRHPNLYLRREAVLALGMMDQPALRDSLARILASDPDTSVRRAATWSLGNLRDSLAVYPLVEALADSSALVRRHVLASLNRLWHVAAAREAAVQALRQDPDPTVRHVAAQLLGKRLWPQAGEALRAALQDRNVWVRAEAATSLGQLGDASAIGDLEELLRQGDGPDQDAARQALLILTGKDYVLVE